MTPRGLTDPSGTYRARGTSTCEATRQEASCTQSNPAATVIRSCGRSHLRESSCAVHGVSADVRCGCQGLPLRPQESEDGELRSIGASGRHHAQRYDHQLGGAKRFQMRRRAHCSGGGWCICSLAARIMRRHACSAHVWFRAEDACRLHLLRAEARLSGRNRGSLLDSARAWGGSDGMLFLGKCRL